MDVTETHSDYFLQQKKLKTLFHDVRPKCKEKNRDLDRTYQHTDNDALLVSCQRKFVMPLENKQPGIVGLAVKRSLKMNDTDKCNKPMQITDLDDNTNKYDNTEQLANDERIFINSFDVMRMKIGSSILGIIELKDSFDIDGDDTVEKFSNIELDGDTGSSSDNDTDNRLSIEPNEWSVLQSVNAEKLDGNFNLKAQLDRNNARKSEKAMSAASSMVPTGVTPSIRSSNERDKLCDTNNNSCTMMDGIEKIPWLGNKLSRIREENEIDEETDGNATGDNEYLKNELNKNFLEKLSTSKSLSETVKKKIANCDCARRNTNSKHEIQSDGEETVQCAYHLQYGNSEELPLLVAHVAPRTSATANFTFTAPTSISQSVTSSALRVATSNNDACANSNSAHSSFSQSLSTTTPTRTTTTTTTKLSSDVSLRQPASSIDHEVHHQHQQNDYYFGKNSTSQDYAASNETEVSLTTDKTKNLKKENDFVVAPPSTNQLEQSLVVLFGDEQQFSDKNKYLPSDIETIGQETKIRKLIEKDSKSDDVDDVTSVLNLIEQGVQVPSPPDTTRYFNQHQQQRIDFFNEDKLNHHYHNSHHHYWHQQRLSCTVSPLCTNREDNNNIKKIQSACEKCYCCCSSCKKESNDKSHSLNQCNDKSHLNAITNGIRPCNCNLSSNCGSKCLEVTLNTCVNVQLTDEVGQLLNQKYNVHTDKNCEKGLKGNHVGYLNQCLDSTCLDATHNEQTNSNKEDIEPAASGYIQSSNPSGLGDYSVESETNVISENSASSTVDSAQCYQKLTGDVNENLIELSEECESSCRKQLNTRKDISDKSYSNSNNNNENKILLQRLNDLNIKNSINERTEKQVSLSPASPVGNFQASNRLQRLEERFKDFACTKKLLRESSNHSSETSFSDYSTSGDEELIKNFHNQNLINEKSTNTKQQSLDEKQNIADASISVSGRSASGIDLLKPSTILSATFVATVNKNKLPSNITANSKNLNETQSEYIEGNENIKNSIITVGDSAKTQVSYANSILSKNIRNQFYEDETRNQTETPESTSTESEEISKIFSEEKHNEKVELSRTGDSENQLIDCAVNGEKDQNEVEKENYGVEDQDEEEDVDFSSVLAGDLFTSCEFDVRHLKQYAPGVGQVYECYDELFDGNSENRPTQEDTSEDDDSNESNSCDCSLEVIPLFRPIAIKSQQKPHNKMRETTGTLRGLLKKPNRPPPIRKNRVMFDETRNEFFEADYIILIREDCPYDEEDEEPCTCGEHELVRLCCEEGCQCSGYSDDCRTPQSPKFAPPIEFVDQATLSPPEGYKDNTTLTNALGGALGGHVFGAQHIQQLQVIQRLQQQRAAMLAARNAAGQPITERSTTTGQTGTQSPTPQAPGPPPVCTECAECAECAAKQLQDGECESPLLEDAAQLEVPHVALVPIQSASPERRVTQKEIIAGEERPKYLAVKHLQETGGQDDELEKIRSSAQQHQQQLQNQRYIVETITMTTVTERRIVREAAEETVPAIGGGLGIVAATPLLGTTGIVGGTAGSMQSAQTTTTTSSTATATTGTNTFGGQKDVASNTDVPALLAKHQQDQQALQQLQQEQLQQQQQQLQKQQQQHQQQQQQQQQHQHILLQKEIYTYPNQLGLMKVGGANSIAANITGILKGGKLRKTEQTQCDESTNVTSDEEGGSKRSVRFIVNSAKDVLSNDTVGSERDVICDGEVQTENNEDDHNVQPELIPMRKHSSLFHNALRPNSAVRQLFPSAAQPSIGTAVGTTAASSSSSSAIAATSTAAPLTHEALRAFEEAKRGHLITTIVHSDSETDTIRRTIERNALRRSLIKYEPKKKSQRLDTSLEERIRQLTCDIDDPTQNTDAQDTRSNSDGYDINEMERRDSPAGEENPPQPKYIMDKSFSPSSSASSSSSGSTSAYRKITDIFHRDRRQERIPEADENPIVIIPQDCRCPAAPDLGMGIQMPAAHTQVHQTPPRQHESRRLLSTFAPLTACVAGQRDDLSYYTLAPGDRTSAASSQCSEYSLGDIEAVLHDDEVKKVAPDVIAGTPGQESDELIAFAQQDAPRTERLKKRYSGETTSAPNSGAASDDDEQNDYGFNKRPSVRGIKPRFGSTNEIIQQMQAQLAQPTVPQQIQGEQSTQIQSHTLPKPHQHSMQVAKQQQQQQQQNQIQSQPAQYQQMAVAQQQQQQQQIAAAAHHQHTASWSYYPADARQLVVEQAQQNSNYYHIPAHPRHSYHGHEEATIYQNCHSVAMEQHHYAGRYARSPTRRPESPPPLRNYHQTMVLIPYNTESYAHYSSNEQVPGQQYRRNVLEYQQVTQQTIRVPVGYPLPGMQLHVVAGRGTTATTTTAPSHFSQFPRLAAPPGNVTYGYTQEKGSVKYTERGAPEGAASIQSNDCNALMSPTSGQCPPNNTSMQTSNSQNTTATTTTAPGSVFYAMNV